jgi:hypothetical protein
MTLSVPNYSILSTLKTIGILTIEPANLDEMKYSKRKITLDSQVNQELA